jgi:hypothetical protein
MAVRNAVKIRRKAPPPVSMPVSASWWLPLHAITPAAVPKNRLSSTATATHRPVSLLSSLFTLVPPEIRSRSAGYAGSHLLGLADGCSSWR